MRNIFMFPFWFVSKFECAHFFSSSTTTRRLKFRRCVSVMIDTMCGSLPRNDQIVTATMKIVLCNTVWLSAVASRWWWWPLKYTEWTSSNWHDDHIIRRALVCVLFWKWLNNSTVSSAKSFVRPLHTASICLCHVLLLLLLLRLS